MKGIVCRLACPLSLLQAGQWNIVRPVGHHEDADGGRWHDLSPTSRCERLTYLAYLALSKTQLSFSIVSLPFLFCPFK